MPDTQPNSQSKPQPRPPGDNRRGAIAGLIIAVVILGVGLWLARDLTAASNAISPLQARCRIA
jgi:hypothetical protein